MEERRSSFKNSFYLVAVVLFVYVLLFEFILPINGLLPRPSYLVKLFSIVWTEYNLAPALSSTILVVYISLIITYLTVYSTVPFLFQWFVKYKNSFDTLSVFKYVPLFFVIIIFNLWFTDKLYAEFIFAFLFSLTLSLNKLFKETGNVKEEYILVAKNLGLTPKEISGQVYWKSVQPQFLKYFEKVHILLWSILLAFEFIGNVNGLGKVFQEASADSNLTAIIIFGIIISVFILFGNLIIESFRKMFTSWEA
jgi:ABC-type nitrate/sulfonate/bicarbonate transport system permease component